MRNKIVAIQGNKLSKLNPTTDTSIFLAKEAQKIGLKLFYYEPQYLSIVNNKVIAKGNFVKFTNNKKFYKILDNKLLDLSTVKYISPPEANFNFRIPWRSCPVKKSPP